MYNFGAGRAYMTPVGQPALELGVIQSATLELKVDLKELRASPRFPIAVADGKGTASGKINFMQMWPQTIAAIIANGAGITNGPASAISAIIGENGTVAATTFIYRLKATDTSGPVPDYTFVQGSEVVTVAVNGNPVFYTRVVPGQEKSASVQGVASGSYSIQMAPSPVLTFAAADVGLPIQVSYMVQASPTSPNSVGTNMYGVTLQKMQMNTAPTFQLMLVGIGRNIYTNAQQQMVVQLKACIAPGIKWNFKLDDFTDLEFDYSAYADVNGVLGSFYFINP